jgi:hypothetical protein
MEKKAYIVPMTMTIGMEGMTILALSDPDTPTSNSLNYGDNYEEVKSSVDEKGTFYGD